MMQLIERVKGVCFLFHLHPAISLPIPAHAKEHLHVRLEINNKPTFKGVIIREKSAP